MCPFYYRLKRGKQSIIPCLPACLPPSAPHDRAAAAWESFIPLFFASKIEKVPTDLGMYGGWRMLFSPLHPPIPPLPVPAPALCNVQGVRN